MSFISLTNAIICQGRSELGLHMTGGERGIVRAIIVCGWDHGGGPISSDLQPLLTKS